MDSLMPCEPLPYQDDGPFRHAEEDTSLIHVDLVAIFDGLQAPELLADMESAEPVQAFGRESSSLPSSSAVQPSDLSPTFPLLPSQLSLTAQATDSFDPCDWLELPDTELSVVGFGPTAINITERSTGGDAYTRIPISSPQPISSQGSGDGGDYSSESRVERGVDPVVPIGRCRQQPLHLTQPLLGEVPVTPSCLGIASYPESACQGAVLQQELYNSGSEQSGQRLQLRTAEALALPWGLALSRRASYYTPVMQPQRLSHHQQQEISVAHQHPLPQPLIPILSQAHPASPPPPPPVGCTPLPYMTTTILLPLEIELTPSTRPGFSPPATSSPPISSIAPAAAAAGDHLFGCPSDLARKLELRVKGKQPDSVVRNIGLGLVSYTLSGVQQPTPLYKTWSDMPCGCNSHAFFACPLVEGRMTNPCGLTSGRKPVLLPDYKVAATEDDDDGGYICGNGGGLTTAVYVISRSGDRCTCGRTYDTECKQANHVAWKTMAYELAYERRPVGFPTQRVDGFDAGKHFGKAMTMCLYVPTMPSAVLWHLRPPPPPERRRRPGLAVSPPIRPSTPTSVPTHLERCITQIMTPLVGTDTPVVLHRDSSSHVGGGAGVGYGTITTAARWAANGTVDATAPLVIPLDLGGVPGGTGGRAVGLSFNGGKRAADSAAAVVDGDADCEPFHRGGKLPRSRHLDLSRC